VAVATEHPSLAILQRLSEARPELLCAYYVQDYEPLFAAPESARFDRAFLSYRAIPGQLLFAKTHWLRNVVTALHGVSVAKVRPSLDRELFHAQGREEEEGVVRVAAMVRPRTPRRRPAATVQALATIRRQLGAAVRTVTFGCDADAYAAVVGELGSDAAGELGAGDEHVGLLRREQVAELMRRCDIFIDASAYQAFGRSGLEAMACGAVPFLPALGGVSEYAEQGRNAVIFRDDRPEAIAEAVLALAGDRARLLRLREGGLATVRDFSIRRAAQTQLDLFTAGLSRRAPSATVSA
jgi:glycosyltransferase involved in cell wall biosynthesis